MAMWYSKNVLPVWYLENTAWVVFRMYYCLCGIKNVMPLCYLENVLPVWYLENVWLCGIQRMYYLCGI